MQAFPKFMAALLMGGVCLAAAEDYIPANVVTDGVPPIPSHVRESAHRYLEFRSAMFTSWHPSEREMLITTRFAETVQVHRLRRPMGAREQITFEPEPVTGALFDPVEGEFFLYAMDQGGSEFYQFYRFDLAEGTSTLLTDGASRNTGAVWSRDGSDIAYISTRRTGRATDVYTMDPRNPAGDRMVLERPGSGWHVLDWMPDGTGLLLGKWISVNESSLWLYSIEDGSLDQLLPPVETGEPIAYRGGAITPDGRTLFTRSNHDSEFFRLVRRDLASGAETVVSSPVDWDVAYFTLSRDGTRLAYLTNEDGRSVIHLLDAETAEPIPIPQLPIGVVSWVSFHPQTNELAASFSGARSSLDIYTLPAGGSDWIRWTRSEAGGLPVESFAEPELIRWESFDGLDISGYLYRPPKADPGVPLPVLISIHGGPEAQFRPRFLARNNFYLNELGVAVIYPNVRGSTGYGKTFVNLDNARLRENSVHDIGALLDWIAAQQELDEDRVAVMGGSYGGYMVLASLMHYGESLRAGINIVGISDFVSFLENTEAYRRDLRRVEYGDERDPEMRAFLTKISPLNNLDRINSPLFVIHGRNDPRVPVSEAEQIVRALQESCKPVWYLLARDEGHGFRRKANADYMFLTIIRFLDEFLSPDP